MNEKEKNMRITKKTETPKNVKLIRINLILFAILHFIYVIVSSTPGSKPVVVRIFIQYWISDWILRKYILKTETDSTKISLYTWGISIVVFLVRILLGILILPLFAK